MRKAPTPRGGLDLAVSARAASMTNRLPQARQTRPRRRGRRAPAGWPPRLPAGSRLPFRCGASRRSTRGPSWRCATADREQVPRPASRQRVRVRVEQAAIAEKHGPNTARSAPPGRRRGRDDATRRHGPHRAHGRSSAPQAMRRPGANLHAAGRVEALAVGTARGVGGSPARRGNGTRRARGRRSEAVQSVRVVGRHGQHFEPHARASHAIKTHEERARGIPPALGRHQHRSFELPVRAARRRTAP